MYIKSFIPYALFSLLAVTRLSAQDSEKALAKVHYTFTHVNDSTQREKFLRDEVVTYLGTTGNYYTSYSKTRAQEEIDKQLKDPGFDGVLNITRNTTGIPQSYLFDKQKMKEIVTIGGDNFALDVDYPILDWTITDETKTIGGYSCQKATAAFKGREYSAWFASELPFSAGPWKLHGLPGLILEAADAKKDVQWLYAGFDKLDNSAIALAAPENAKPSTQKEVRKLQEAFQANPQAYMEAKGRIRVAAGSTPTGGAGRATITVRSSGSAAGSSSSSTLDASRIKSVNIKSAENYSPSKNTNNPIELIP
ncbi:GLPGLI family protein [Sphingobacterium paludis]|uniref:GLPGLI family protein n=1 Tax=Sphingobacterium paludis TaxID=1476465 RepID=A0A4R7D127_9SPHI|nr:GLPGLI family protein [Sphingobacterium paludis]TDS14673.1 GLPGLI family protein [Sphingobacterium paludis]